MKFGSSSPACSLPTICLGSRFYFVFLFYDFFLLYSRNNYFNRKVGYTFGHDNEEDGLNLSVQIPTRGISRTFMTKILITTGSSSSSRASSHSLTA